MVTASLIHAVCSISPRFFGNINNSSSFNNGVYTPPGDSSSSFSGRETSKFSSGLNSNCKNQGLKAQAAMSAVTQGNLADSKGVNWKSEPDHLLVLVHGIMGSPSDWTYVEAELKRRLGRKFLIYASSSNTYLKTFAGIDGAGKRLADEVMQVVQKMENLKRISFLSHSLGGLITRYAISDLYSPNTIDGSQADDHADSVVQYSQKVFSPRASFLLGVPILEKLAAPIAPIVVGRTGSQLFLTDGKPDRPPLLLRMASDCEDRNFLSALGAFRCRIIYANVSYDHMVGWRTSSIRREAELVKPPRRSLVGYKHVVDVEYCPPVPSDGPNFPSKAVNAKEAAQNTPSTQNTNEYHEIMEEEMICGLQKLGWRKVDVSFHSAFWPYSAHNNINVKSEWFHYAGAGVVAHVADSLNQQESSLIPACL